MTKNVFRQRLIWTVFKLVQITIIYISLYIIVYSAEPRSLQRDWERGCVVLCIGAGGTEPAGVLIYFAGAGVGAGKTQEAHICAANYQSYISERIYD